MRANWPAGIPAKSGLAALLRVRDPCRVLRCSTGCRGGMVDGRECLVAANVALEGCALLQCSDSGKSAASIEGRADMAIGPGTTTLVLQTVCFTSGASFLHAAPCRHSAWLPRGFRHQSQIQTELDLASVGTCTFTQARALWRELSHRSSGFSTVSLPVSYQGPRMPLSHSISQRS